MLHQDTALPFISEDTSHNNRNHVLLDCVVLCATLAIHSCLCSINLRAYHTSYCETMLHESQAFLYILCVEALATLHSRLPSQRYLYIKHPWKTELVSPCGQRELSSIRESGSRSSGFLSCNSLCVCMSAGPLRVTFGNRGLGNHHKDGNTLITASAVSKKQSFASDPKTSYLLLM